MTQEHVKRELSKVFQAYHINQAAFYSEANFVDEHMEYITEQCGGEWDNEKAAEVLELLRRSLN